MFNDDPLRLNECTIATAVIYNKSCIVVLLKIQISILESTCTTKTLKTSSKSCGFWRPVASVVVTLDAQLIKPIFR